MRKWFSKGDRGGFDMTSMVFSAFAIAVMGAMAAVGIFWVLPWAQDTMAKNSVEAAVKAQNVARAMDGSYVDEARLAELGLMASKDLDKVDILALDSPWVGLKQDGQTVGNHFVALVKSKTGKYFSAHNGFEKPEPTTVPKPGGPTMAMRWDTSRPGCTTITLPAAGTVTGEVWWGDEKITRLTAPLPSHTYDSKQGIVEVEIFGTFTEFNMAKSAGTRASAACLISVGNWADTKTTNLTRAFEGAISLTSAPNIPSGVTDISSAFYGATAFNGDVSAWDTSQVTNMSGTFEEAVIFNKPLSNWDTSKVIQMSRMFKMASKFNQPLTTNLNKWNTGNVRTMDEMFAGATSFNRPLSSWNVQYLANAGDMFFNAISFNQDISAWNFTQIGNLSGMFKGATAFNQPLDRWNVRTVQHTNGMFQNATSFNQPLNGWVTSSLTQMYNMFDGASSFNQPLNNWDTADVYGAEFMFKDSAFNHPLDRWNMRNMRYISGMFQNAKQFDQDVSMWVMPYIERAFNMFSGSSINRNLSALDLRTASLSPDRVVDGTPIEYITAWHPRFR